MALCPICNTRFTKNTSSCTDKCRYCTFAEETFDSSVQDEINTLLNPSGVTQVIKYDEIDE
jgi:glutaredoxin